MCIFFKPKVPHVKEQEKGNKNNEDVNDEKNYACAIQRKTHMLK